MYVAVTLDFTIDKVKSIATEHFYGHDKTRPASQFRMVHATMLKPLADERNLGEEKISESGMNFQQLAVCLIHLFFHIPHKLYCIIPTDELLLVEVRPLVEKENLSEDALKGPTDEEILNATKDLPVRNPAKPAVTSDCPADVNIHSD